MKDGYSCSGIVVHVDLPFAVTLHFRLWRYNMVLLKTNKQTEKIKDFKLIYRSRLYGNTPSSRQQKRLYGNMLRQKQKQNKNRLYGNMLSNWNVFMAICWGSKNDFMTIVMLRKQKSTLWQYADTTNYFTANAETTEQHFLTAVCWDNNENRIKNKIKNWRKSLPWNFEFL